MTAKDEVNEIQKVLSGKAILNLQKLVRSVPVGDFVIDYVTRLVRAHAPEGPDGAGVRQEDGRLRRGVRAGQYLIQAGKAFAAMDGRFSVAIDDIRKAAPPVLRHRIATNFQAQAEGQDQRGHHRRIAQDCRGAGTAEVWGEEEVVNYQRFPEFAKPAQGYIPSPEAGYEARRTSATGFRSPLRATECSPGRGFANLGPLSRNGRMSMTALPSENSWRLPFASR